MKTYSVVFKGWRASQVIDAYGCEVRDGRYWFATGSTGQKTSLPVDQVACVLETSPEGLAIESAAVSDELIAAIS